MGPTAVPLRVGFSSFSFSKSRLASFLVVFDFLSCVLSKFYVFMSLFMGTQHVIE